MSSSSFREKLYSVGMVGVSMFSFLLITIIIQTSLSYLDYVKNNIEAGLFTSLLITVLNYIIYLLFLSHINKGVRVSLPEKGFDIYVCLIIVFMSFFVQSSVSIILDFLSDIIPVSESERAFFHITMLHPWYGLVLTLIIAPLFEELVFRKYILRYLLGNFSTRYALIISALFFGIFHLNIRQFLFASMLGMILGYVYLRSGKIIYSILIHFFFNLFGMIMPLPIFEIIHRPIYSLIVFFLCIISVIILVLLLESNGGLIDSYYVNSDDKGDEL